MRFRTFAEASQEWAVANEYGASGGGLTGCGHVAHGIQHTVGLSRAYTHTHTPATRDNSYVESKMLIVTHFAVVVIVSYRAFLSLAPLPAHKYCSR